MQQVSLLAQFPEVYIPLTSGADPGGVFRGGGG